MAQKRRDYCYTLNNYTDDELVQLRIIGCEYHVMGKEVGEKGTPHIQGYIRFRNARSFNAVRKLIDRWHLIECRGSAADNIAYCTKDGNYEEIGTRPKQGKRVDLDKIKNDIIEGKKVEDICIEDPMTYHMYGRTLNKIEDIAMRKNYRTEMTKGIWYWGETGVGKSHKAFEGFTPETHYVLPNDNGWWDAYKQQDTVIINDFRGEIKYNELLNLVDKWPFTVKRRNREPLPFTSKLVIITSSLPPDQIYHNRNDEDKIEQLLRRFVVTKVGGTSDQIGTGTEVVGGNTSSDPPPPYEDLSYLLDTI